MRNLKLLFLIPSFAIVGCTDLSTNPTKVNKIIYVVGDNKESVVIINLDERTAKHEYMTVYRCAVNIDPNIQACGDGSKHPSSVNAAFTTLSKESFLESIKDCGLYEMENSYLLPGESELWSITINYTNGNTKKSVGNSNAPKSTIWDFKEAIRTLTGFNIH